MKNIPLKLSQTKRRKDSLKRKKLKNLILKYSFFIILTLLVPVSAQKGIDTGIKTLPPPVLPKNDYKKMYEEAYEYYKLGSYYSSINILYKLIARPQNPYYSKSLYLLAKIYIKIGRKTGLKKYFSTALYLLNMYSGTQKKLNWDYFYTKAYLLEVWGFPERAMSFYKFALYNSVNKKQELKTLIGILRTGIWTKKLDLITLFAIRLSMEKLFKQNSEEVQFLKGLLLFQEEKYDEASKFMIETYKYYEPYLIDNPEFYYIVAENMYRVKSFKFAQQLFRRISGITQDLYIIRKSILRLGDIDIQFKDYVSAFNHYYYLSTDYKETPEAIIAKLKIISLKDIQQIKKKLMQIEDDEDFKNPIKFVYQTLINNRNTTVGRYALGNAGQIFLKYNSDFLIDRLGWELSITEVDRFNYEEKEYIRNLWKPYIKTIAPKHLCKLYKSNKRFFKTVFEKNTLLQISKKLYQCNPQYAIDLFTFIAQKYNDDTSKLELANALFNIKQFKKSLSVLKKVKTKNCKYYNLYAKNYISLNNLKPVKKYLPNIQKCKSVQTKLITAYFYIKENRLKEALNIITSNKQLFLQMYGENFFVQNLINEFVVKNIDTENYQVIIQVLKDFTEKYSQDCNINSWYLIAMLRINPQYKANIQKLQSCETIWSNIAKNIYEDLQIERRIK